MNIDERIALRWVPLIAVSVCTLGLAACKPAAEGQASKDSGRVVEQSPSPATGKAIERAKSGAASDNSPRVRTVDDVALNIKVEDALKENPMLKSQDIAVYTAGGVVTLTGTTDSSASRDQAAQVVMNVTGVKGVDNKLSVRGA
jgi:osmotically-inducible protein OsmY